jgi:hypothetical protein
MGGIQSLRMPEGRGRMGIEIGMMLSGQHTVGGADLRQRTAAVQAERGVMVREMQRKTGLLRGFVGAELTRRWFGFFCGGKQVGAFEQAAEILFSGLDQAAIAGIYAGHGFVFHGEALKFDDPDIFAALFPELALGEFHGWN